VARERSTKPGTAALEAGSAAPSVAWRALPYLVFALLYALSFKRWILPFQDSGREMFTPMRLLDGEVLYRDVGSWYGPVPAYLDMAILKVFGRDLDALIAIRTLVALLGVEALRRLSLRVFPARSTAAFATTFVVAACMFGLGGAYPFPYSVAALEGTVGTWWALELGLAAGNVRQSLLAAVVAGVAGGAKLEILPAALLAVGVPLLLRRPRREAAAAIAVATVLSASAFLGPIMLFGADTLRRHGFLVAMSPPPSWRQLYVQQVILGGMTPQAFWHGGGWLRLLFPSGVLLAGAILVMRRNRLEGLPIAVAAAAAGLATAFVPRNEELHVLLPVAALVTVIEVARRAASIVLRRPPPSDHVFLCLGLAALPALARQPLFFVNQIYGAFATPLAILLAWGWISARVRSGAMLAGLLAGLTGAQAWDRVREYRESPVEWTSLPGARLYLPKEESQFVKAAADRIRLVTPERAYVAVFPEPGFLLFVTGRRSPFVDETFAPGAQGARSEAEMIERLQQRRPAAILVTNRPFPEYGSDIYGQGILDRFVTELSKDYVAVERIGGPPAPLTRVRRASEGILFLPRGVSLP
jgi:hypothetical protein